MRGGGISDCIDLPPVNCLHQLPSFASAVLSLPVNQEHKIKVDRCDCAVALNLNVVLPRF
jgi:hypothetical protein